MKHNKVRVIAASQPATALYEGMEMTGEALTAYIARVSSPNQENPDYQKLLTYCKKNAHWSVFEHVFVTIEVTTSRTIARQLLRHKSFCFQEFSQRYQEVTETFPILWEARSQDLKNRQKSNNDMTETEKTRFESEQLYVWNTCINAYDRAIAGGVAKEQARALLPEGMTTSKLYVTGNLRSWLHYVQIRMGNGTQSEHIDLATKINDLLAEHYRLLFASSNE